MHTQCVNPNETVRRVQSNPLGGFFLPGCVASVAITSDNVYYRCAARVAARKRGGIWSQWDAAWMPLPVEVTPALGNPLLWVNPTR